MSRTIQELSDKIVGTVYANLDNNCDWSTPRSTVEYMVAVMILGYIEDTKENP
jgi:hypothetical protein